MGARIYIATMCTCIYWYSAVRCCISCPPGRRSSFDGFMVSLSFIELLKHFRTITSNFLIQVSKPDMDARGGTKSSAFHVESCHHADKTAHATIDVRSRHRINPRPTRFVSANKASECRWWPGRYWVDAWPGGREVTSGVLRFCLQPIYKNDTVIDRY